MKFQYKSDDGEVRLLKLNEMQNPSTSLVRNPRQGTTCSFKILKLSNFSTEHNETDGRGNKLVRSAYCPDVDPERCVNADIVSATIGLTSVSELDRLLEVCLTKLHVGESGEFGITCSRSKSLFNISLKLVSIEESPELFDLSPEKLLEIASLLKDEGVRLFSSAFIIDAFYKFSKAVQFLCLTNPANRNEHYHNLVCKLRNNIAGCHVKMGNWEYVVELCSDVLQQDSSNVKALYRRGWSYIELQEFEKASEDLQQAKILEPENQAVKTKLATLEEKSKALNIKYAQAMKKFFS